MFLSNLPQSTPAPGGTKRDPVSPVLGRGNVIFSQFFCSVLCGGTICTSVGRVHCWHIAVPSLCHLGGVAKGYDPINMGVSRLEDTYAYCQCDHDGNLTRKRPPLVTGLALPASQLRGLLEKRATYAVRRSVTVINVDNDDA